ncbi:Uncharacterized protein TCM_015462 [Theobroma cacao]|uniref:RNase H type-1 domain-containing protein n=1 Tax=Theobroma cacao TaxID=3641 RepID=A0A061G227_THECC|nr:Uncharacterized protein TCM_015462 [Theobroma cacao]
MLNCKLWGITWVASGNGFSFFSARQHGNSTSCSSDIRNMIILWSLWLSCSEIVFHGKNPDCNLLHDIILVRLAYRPGSAGKGGVIRDHEGFIKGIFSHHIGIEDSNYAELLAIKEGDGLAKAGVLRQISPLPTALTPLMCLPCPTLCW